MFHDRGWFFTDEPTVMWGRQLQYVNGKGNDDYIVTPDQHRFTTLRRAFAIYRVGTGLRGPGDEQLEVTRPRSGVLTHVGWLEFLHSYNRWLSVDPNLWASGIIVASDGDDS